MKTIIVLLILLGLGSSAKASILKAGENITINFDSLALIGGAPYGDQTSINFNYSRGLVTYTLTLDGGLIQTTETNSFDILLYEDINQTTPDHSYTVENQTSLGITFPASPTLDGVNSTQFWGDLNGSMTLSILQGNVYLDSIDVLVNLSGQKYFQSFMVAAVPVPSAVWLFGSGMLSLIGVAGKK